MHSWLFWVNFLGFQWFFIRLCQHVNDEGQTVRWSFVRWVIPITGWWTDYIYWPHNAGMRKRGKWDRLSVHQKLDLILEQNCLLLEQNERLIKMALDLNQVISDLNTNTNAVSARLDKLIADLAAAGQAPTAEQLASLQAISDHLKAMGQDPAAPIPAPPADPTVPATP